ncbi:MAG: alpha/beta fold hydrolase [Betaproteobacteria bacterium]|nr:alpha/beta fold hydrolase [Betaproteobacteria bacterium]
MTLQTHIARDFRLESGAGLAEAVTAYRTLGQLNAEGTNAVLILHGYTTGPAMLDAGANVAEGSWSDLVGPGKAIDSNRYFVVCPNMLGSSYGSTGPGSIDPATKEPYGIDFPAITLKDIVALQKRLLDNLGVTRLAAVAGPSLGGYQSLQWAVSYPAFVERVVAAVSAPFNPPSAVQSTPLRAQLALEPAWNSGHPAPGAMRDWLARLRVATLTRYGVDADLAPRFPDQTARAAEIQRLAMDWAAVFDACSLLTLAHAAENFDLRARLSEIRAPLLMVMSRSDSVFSPQLAREFAPLLSAAGVRWSYFELDSNKGHFASGADAHLWSDTLREFLSTAPMDWVPQGMTT